MSFILEALKKSEEQRQEKHVSQQKVRNRTLSLTSSQPGRRPYWLLAGVVSLVLLCGWWLYSNQETTLEPPLEVSPVTSVTPEPSPAKEEEPLVTDPVPLETTPQQPVAVAESAPVPSIYVSPPPVKARAKAAKNQEFSVRAQQVDPTPTETINTAEQIETVEMAQPQPQAIDARPLESRVGEMPFYSELPGEMRGRMPPLAMSMHFYNREPNRRLVRINGRLLREGDWVSRELELVEITQTGVILDFLGSTFELRSSGR